MLTYHVYPTTCLHNGELRSRKQALLTGGIIYFEIDRLIFLSIINEIWITRLKLAIIVLRRLLDFLS